MRTPEYLSPSSLNKFYNDREQYYIEYLSDAKPPREPQNNHMAIGSAFDAYIKSYLHEKLIGKDPAYEKTTLFEMQVEPHNRDLVRNDAQIIFDQYLKSGCVADLLLELNKCLGLPTFESEIRGTISKDIHSVPLLGRPDLRFLSQQSCRVILDWKVNGHYTRSPHSPMKGYLRLLNDGPVTQHKDCYPSKHKGVTINIGHNLEDLKSDWADQFSIYAWLCGEPIGADFIVAVDQIVCDNTKSPRKIRFAQHRMLVSAEYQHKLYDRAAQAWKAITTKHIFFETDRATSDAKCAVLEQQAKNLASNSEEKATFLKAFNRER